MIISPASYDGCSGYMFMILMGGKIWHRYFSEAQYLKIYIARYEPASYVHHEGVIHHHDNDVEEWGKGV